MFLGFYVLKYSSSAVQMSAVKEHKSADILVALPWLRNPSQVKLTQTKRLKHLQGNLFLVFDI